MAALFYLVLAFFSKEVPFNLLWFLAALVFSSNEAKTIYRFTTDPKLDGQVVK